VNALEIRGARGRKVRFVDQLVVPSNMLGLFSCHNTGAIGASHNEETILSHSSIMNAGTISYLHGLICIMYSFST